MPTRACCCGSSRRRRTRSAPEASPNLSPYPNPSPSPDPNRDPDPSQEEADTEEEGALQEAGEPPVVPPPPFKALPRLQPVAGAQLHLQPISSLLAGRHALLTACVGGQVQTWARPEPNPHPDANPAPTRNPPPEPARKSPLQVKTWARPSEHDARCPAGRAPLANGGKAP